MQLKTKDDLVAPLKSPQKKYSLFCVLLLMFGCTQAWAFSLRQPSETFADDEPIPVLFEGFSSTTDWVTLVKVGTPDDEFGDWYYTDGLKAGTLTFQPHAAGKYEVRAYCCWFPGQKKDGGYVVKARLSFTIYKANKVEKSEYKTAGQVCRDLLKDDLYVAGWTHCCDLGPHKSRWTKRTSLEVETYEGSCAYWGVF